MIPLRHDLLSDRIAQRFHFGAHGEQWVTMFVDQNDQLTVERLTEEQVAGWLPLAEGVHEHGQLFTNRGVLVWPDHASDTPWVRDIPLEERIQNTRKNGGKVLRRKVIVLEEWEEVES